MTITIDKNVHRIAKILPFCKSACEVCFTFLTDIHQFNGLCVFLEVRVWEVSCAVCTLNSILCKILYRIAGNF